MKVVIDANIIFAMLISGKNIYIEILEGIEAYSPDFILKEIEKYENFIIRKTHVKNNFNHIIHNFFKKITIIPKIAISKNSFQVAYKLCKEIDEKDTPYVALSLELDAYLWSNDKKLKNELNKKNFGKVLTTDDMILLLRGK